MDNTNKLGSEKISKLIFSLGLPAVAAQLINVLYNIVDRIYIGNIPGYGDLALTGVGVTLPIILIISAFAAFAGMGGAPLASIELGKKNVDEAEKILGNSLSMLLVLSAILTSTFLLFKEPLLYAFGASENIINYSLDYITIYLYGTIFVQLALGLNTFISAQGYAKTAMISVVIGALINIVLDPIFIFGFGLGVKGAAIATVISQAVSALWILRFLLFGNGVLKIKKSKMKLSKKTVLTIISLGISPFVMQSTESLVSITLNSGLQNYGGDLYVGSMTILMSIMQLIVMPINGFAQGAQPIISYNYGAGNYDRVRETFKNLLIITFSLSSLWCALTFLIPGIFARMFTQSPELIAITSKVMPIFFAGIFIFGVQIACQSTFLALGEAKISLFLALVRKIFLLIPLALVLPKFFGVKGIYFSEPIADITASIITLSIFIWKRDVLLPVQKTHS
ncbi:MAG: MATE family efflux transporter [Proteocatella sp.]